MEHLIESMPAKAFAPKEVDYVDVFDLHTLYKGLAFRAPTITVGPKGIGKTLSYQAFAYAINSPIITFDCSEDVRRAHLIGLQFLRGNESPFILGPLTTAIRVANEVGLCILCLEEINALTPQMQKVLNAITDWRRKIEVPEVLSVFELVKNAKLWVVGTMNNAVYGGVYALNEDLKSRVRLISVDYPTTKAEQKILKTLLNGFVKNVEDKTITKLLMLAHETRQKALDYALSTRDLMQLVEDYALMGPEAAFRIVLGKFEGADRDTVAQRITSIFGISFGQAP